MLEEVGPCAFKVTTRKGKGDEEEREREKERRREKERDRERNAERGECPFVRPTTTS